MKFYPYLIFISFIFMSLGGCKKQSAVVGAFLSGNPAASDLAYSAYTKTLPVPPLLPFTTSADGTKQFQLQAQAGSTQFGTSAITGTYGYNGSYLGPTIQVKQNVNVEFTIKNQLGEATSVHWHGLRIPASMDGGPHQSIPAGGTWSPQFTINQPAATLWYHPHQLGQTGAQVYKGLAGFFLVEDTHSASLDLPKIYGVDDIPVVIQDRRINVQGEFLYMTHDMEHMGATGDIMLANGAIQPYFKVTTDKIRLRLLNGSNARTYDFGFGGKVSE